MKSGALTSEFWLTLATLGIVGGLMYNGNVTENNGLVVIGALVAWWTGNRTLIKIKNGNNKP